MGKYHRNCSLYYKKYDYRNAGIIYVFDSLYSKLISYSIKSNIMACPGADLNRYIKYAKAVYSTSKGKAFFIELKNKRYLQLKKILADKDKKTKNRIKIIHDDIFKYDSNRLYPLARPCRVEDFGLGIGIRESIYKVMGRLYDQKSRCDGQRLKAQILGSSIRQIPKDVIIELYQMYLSVLGLEIKSINGYKSTNPNCLSVNNAEKILTYHDHTGKKGNVYKYHVKLSGTRRSDMTLYSYYNGSPMLTSMIIYK